MLQGFVVAGPAGGNLVHAPPRGSQPHGTYYLCSNWDFNALGAIFEQETGRNIGPTATGPCEGACTAMRAMGQYIMVLPKPGLAVG